MSESTYWLLAKGMGETLYMTFTAGFFQLPHRFTARYFSIPNA